MQSLPLAARLKRRAHRDVAYVQDLLVAELLDAFPGSTLHGGTAIWRCYAGARFSEDVDAYIPRYTDESGERFRAGVRAKGMRLPKLKATRGTVFGDLEVGGTSVSLEAARRPPPSRVVRWYETLDGRRMLVPTLPADDLLVEKASAYRARRKVRDLYDVFFLAALTEGREKARKGIDRLLREYRPPVDESTLRAIILAGAVPTAAEMLDGLREWGRRST